MNKDKFLFLELFGEIDSLYIDKSFEPWHEKKILLLYKCRTKIACAILVAVLVGGCVYHTEVKAALEKVAILISGMLGIEEDISSFTDKKNISVTHNGLTLTIEEVILDKNQLYILISKKFESDKKKTDTELLENVKINGTKLNILKEYITDTTLDESAHKYVLSYYLNDDILNDDNLEIEAIFTIKKADEGGEIGKYQFKFNTSYEELEKETSRIPMNQSIMVSENVELKLSMLTLNSVESSIVANCKDLPLGNEYYLKGKDNCGNQVVYRLFSYENPDIVFVKEIDSHISPNATKLELQLYQHNLGELNSISEEGEFIAEDYIDENGSEMEPVGDSFVVNIKKANTEKEVKYTKP